MSTTSTTSNALPTTLLKSSTPTAPTKNSAKSFRKEEDGAQTKSAFNATRFSMTNRGDGTTRGVFNIPNADADTLRAAIEGLINPRRAATNATNLDMNLDDFNALPRDQKMGHAFIELINHLPTDALPQSGGLAATVAVTIDIDDLRTGQGFATNTSGTDVSATKAQRMACNAHLVGLYLDSDSRVINHGMTKRLFDRHQRPILAGRDGGCVWKGLGVPPHKAHSGGEDRPPAWCEAHHLNFWSETDPPTSTTQPCSATSTTFSCTKANGQPAWHPTASSKSSHPPTSTPTKHPDATPDTPDTDSPNPGPAPANTPEPQGRCADPGPPHH
ncbi:DUF222 domain-containing protein [Aeromicrobium sp. UC242_57]|uniref:DUF222 domain-containing protein n=1 Tax=Aeromicrobium sp. UC242_57 TaxID=3374624 RepID=UPI0037936989